METPTKSPPPSRAKHKQSNAMAFKYLPRAATFTLPSLPFSPSHDPKPTATHNRAFSGSISLIPNVTRQGSTTSIGAEPTSPKVSCMGQVKKRRQHVKNNKNKEERKGGDGTAGGSFMSRIFRGRNSAVRAPPQVTGQPPRLMRRFGSGKERAKSLDGFDWTAATRARIVVAEPVEGVVGKKEVNLWKRRDVGPILPLELGVPSASGRGPSGRDDSGRNSSEVP